MRNYKQEALELLTAARSLRAELDFMTVQQEVLADVQALLDKIAPEIMFYGIYNSGKSSLLNAMLSPDGTEIAAVADAPCTAVVTPYELAGYVIHDTPGLDAPPEHERVSKAQLARSHAVVFVVSDSGNFEEARVTDELGRIHANSKALLVAVNMKQGGDLASQEFQNKVRALQNKLAKATGQDPAVCGRMIFGVNAHRAIDARRDKNQARFEASGVPALQEAVIATLSRIDGPKLLLPALQQLRSVLQAMRKAAAANDTAGQAAAAEKMSTALRLAKKGFVESVEMEIRTYRDTNTKAVRVAIEHGGGDELNAVLAHFVQIVEKYVETNFPKAVQEFGREFAASLPPIVIGPRVSQAGIDDGAEKSAADWLSQVDYKRLATLVQTPKGIEAIEQGLRGLRAVKFPGLNGRWNGTLTRWAGRIGKGLGVFLTVATTVLEVRRIRQEEAKRLEGIRDRQRQIQDSAETVAHDVEVEVLAQLPAVSDEMFAPLQGSLAKHMSAMKAEQSKWMRAIQEIDAIDARVATLEGEIRAAVG